MSHSLNLTTMQLRLLVIVDTHKNNIADIVL